MPKYAAARTIRSAAENEDINVHNVEWFPASRTRPVRSKKWEQTSPSAFLSPLPAYTLMIFRHDRNGQNAMMQKVIF